LTANFVIALRACDVILGLAITIMFCVHIATLHDPYFTVWQLLFVPKHTKDSKCLSTFLRPRRNSPLPTFYFSWLNIWDWRIKKNILAETIEYDRRNTKRSHHKTA